MFDRDCIFITQSTARRLAPIFEKMFPPRPRDPLSRESRPPQTDPNDAHLTVRNFHSPELSLNVYQLTPRKIANRVAAHVSCFPRQQIR